MYKSSMYESGRYVSLLVITLMVFGLLSTWGFANAADRVGNVPFHGKTMAKNLASAAIQVQGANNATELVEALIGNGVSYSNVTTTCQFNTNQDNVYQAGFFSNAASVFGLDSGVVMSSGNIAGIVGPNTSDSFGYSWGTAGDANLDSLSGKTTHDACVLEFDFIPQKSVVSFQYVFASDEYNEYVFTSFNDVFALLVNGQNCALVNGFPASIDTINSGNPYDPTGTTGVNAAYYINNDLSDGGGSYDTEMDGFSKVLTCVAPVNAGQTNHLKLAIADASDTIFDSNVLIGANAIVSVDYNVTVNAPIKSKTDLPGKTVTYKVEVENIGAKSDTFTIAATGNAWQVKLDQTQIGPLPSLTSGYLTVTVTIPSEAVTGNSDTVTITATSNGDPTKSASANLTTSVATFSCTSNNAVRTLPDYCIPGVPVPVTIKVDICENTNNYIIEEKPPAGWTAPALSTLPSECTIEADGVTLFCNFADAKSRVLTYYTIPPTGVGTGTQTFSGTVTVGWQGSSYSSPITNTKSTDFACIASGFHPADKGQDWLISVGDLAGYISAYLTGIPWPTWNPVKIDFVTNAVYLFLATANHQYLFDSSLAGQAPLCWIPSSVSVSASSSQAEAAPFTATRSLSVGAYVAGQQLTATVTVTTDATIKNYTVTETPPDGWTISEISNNGKLDVSGNVNWVLQSGTGNVLTYKATPPVGSTGNQTFSGQASYNTGTVLTIPNTVISDLTCIYTVKPVKKDFPFAGGSVVIKVTATGTGCTLLPSTNVGWITLQPGKSFNPDKKGIYKGTVKVKAAKNTSSIARPGTVYIGDKSVPINQAGQKCALTALTPARASFAATGGTGSFVVKSTPLDCTWSVTQDANNPADMITLVDTFGVGTGTVNYSVGPNAATKARKGKIIVSLDANKSKKKIFKVQQK